MHMWMPPFLHQRMKTQKAKDECGLVAELLKHLPEDVLTKLLALMNDFLFSRELPSTWREGQSSNITQPSLGEDVAWSSQTIRGDGSIAMA